MVFTFFEKIEFFYSIKDYYILSFLVIMAKTGFSAEVLSKLIQEEEVLSKLIRAEKLSKLIQGAFRDASKNELTATTINMILGDDYAMSHIQENYQSVFQKLARDIASGTVENELFNIVSMINDEIDKVNSNYFKELFSGCPMSTCYY